MPLSRVIISHVIYHVSLDHVLFIYIAVTCDRFCDMIYFVRGQKKIVEFTVTRPIRCFGADPKVSKQTQSMKIFKTNQKRFSTNHPNFLAK